MPNIFFFPVLVSRFQDLFNYVLMYPSTCSFSFLPRTFSCSHSFGSLLSFRSLNLSLPLLTHTHFFAFISAPHHHSSPSIPSSTPPSTSRSFFLHLPHLHKHLAPPLSLFLPLTLYTPLHQHPLHLLISPPLTCVSSSASSTTRHIQPSLHS